MVDHSHATREETLNNVQANLLRVSKFTIGNRPEARNWSLFFFFRILSRAEFDATAQRVKAASADDIEAKHILWLDFAQPALLNAGLAGQASTDATSPAPDEPADAFLNWLRALVSADKSGLQNTVRILTERGVAKTSVEAEGGAGAGVGIEWTNPSAWIEGIFKAQSMDASLIQRLVQVYSEPREYLARLEMLRQNVGKIVPDGLVGPLPIVVLYESLRQCAPAMVNDNVTPSSVGMVRSESSATVSFLDPSNDVTPINIAFTHSGLAALKIDGTTLASFPDAFKQGMAARAFRVHDTGPSAPEFWDGELGLPSVHGYFTGCFPFSGGNSPKESFWKAMRADVEAFNDPVSVRGQVLRFWLQMLFRAFGLEVLHIELGQDPYIVGKNTDAVINLENRLEHFGFRDGLSQPFVDMGLGDTLPGGGTPSRNRTWTPVAPGEIFLSQPDEDGETQLVPISKKLALGATFLVFRKLEQDVAGFRSFLSRQRPRDRNAQTALAAQFVGRWPNGTPLVLSPEAEREINPRAEAVLNDFRYAADDRDGRRCPLGAHIRRANPRDIGGRDEVRRHRILRRSISYGGPLLKEGVLGDGERRGLLFIAANSRIDLQFEVVQADWINGGEFLGQAGLGRCPLIGDHQGSVSDSFLEAGAPAPVVGLPRFVVTRGGDYFFAPGIAGLKMISEGQHFEPEKDELPFAGFSMGDTTTPALFDPERLRLYAGAILSDGHPPAVHVEVPRPTDGSNDRICFVGRYADVRRVLRDEVKDNKLEFSVRQYRLAGRHITRGQDLIIGTDKFGPTALTRTRLHEILEKAWLTLRDGLDGDGVENALRNIVKSALDKALRRTAAARRIDLINDLASQATYAVITRFYGIPGPEWLTELGAALPFAHQHVGELPPDWIATLKGERPDDTGIATMQIWSAIILADLVGNLQSMGPLHVLSRQAGSEMLDYLDGVVALARSKPLQSARTLLEAFVKNESSPEIRELYKGGFDPEEGESGWKPLYYRDVSTILLEITGTSMATIPLTFASVIGALFKFRIDLAKLLRTIPRSAIAPLIYEAERLNPNIGVRMRYCETTTTLPSGAVVEEGEWVAALIAAANLDQRTFAEPSRLLLDRSIENYLLFNDIGSDRACWGRDRVAMAVLEECLTAAGRLEGLRRVAGAAGEPSKLVGVTIGLQARFTRVAA